MRILLTYGRHRPYPPFGIHLAEAFRALGHQVIFLGVRDLPWWEASSKRLFGRRRPRSWSPATWANARLLEAVDRYRPDAVLEIGGDLFDVPTLRQAKRRTGTRLAVWLVEGPGTFYDLLQPKLEAYELIASTSRVVVQQLRQAGLRQAAYLPLATEPRWFQPAGRGSGRERFPVGFVGAYSLRRDQFLEPLVGFPLHIWGTEWDRASAGTIRQALQGSRGVFGRALVRCYQHTTMHLSVQRENMTYQAPSGERVATGLNFRLFDVPACGTLILTEWVQELPEAFVVGEEVETFTSPDELREKVRYWLAHDAARQTLIQRSRARVLRDHTCEQRARQWLKWFDTR